MAFWMDPFLLVILGTIVAYIAKRWMYNSDLFIPSLFVLILTIFYFVSVGMFCNLPITEPLWKKLGCESGTEYMVNGLIFDIVPQGSSWTSLAPWAMFTSIIMFVLYPLWLLAGIVLGRKLFGTYPWES